MGIRMTHTARAELTQVVRRRYCAATGAEKRKILDEFIAVTGYHEKSAIRVLNSAPAATAPRTRNRVLSKKSDDVVANDRAGRSMTYAE